ncbi:hypothetical protein [Streptomyces tanashiensis]|uniref:hypothetical protein n=1 Tax=Streptomyces tanashiensis TaxID=67367 RepID=UPI00342842F8
MTDAQRALTGQVQAVQGHFLTLVRPSGYLWEAAVDQCWTASPEERAGLTPRGAVRIINANGVTMGKHGGGTGSGSGGSQQDDSSSGRGHGGGGSETSGGNSSDGSGPAKK